MVFVVFVETVTKAIKRYEMDSDLPANTGIDVPLLSRFDLVIVLLDEANLKWDKKVSEFILKQHTIDSRKRVKTNKEEEEKEEEEKEDLFSIEKLQSYLSFVKMNFDPTFTTEGMFSNNNN